jgi:hypothetical protein
LAQTALVETDIEAGRAFVELLDRIGIIVKGAFWLYAGDADRWRLVIATDKAKAGSRELYLEAIKAGARIDLTSVDFQSPDTPLFKAISEMIHVEGLGQIRMSQNAFNGVYVQDALVYRTAA